MTVTLIVSALAVGLAVILYAIAHPLYDELSLAEKQHVHDLEALNADRQEEWETELRDWRQYGVIRNPLYDELRQLAGEPETSAEPETSVWPETGIWPEDDTPTLAGATPPVWLTEALDGYPTVTAWIDAVLAEVTS